MELEYVSRLARTVLIKLGDEAPDWRIGEIGFLQIGGVLALDEPTDLIRVALESLSGSYPNVGVQFTTIAPFDDATVELATQVQEQAFEVTHGAKVPPCPGHRHPAIAVSIDGVPRWVCQQQGASYYAEDILPRFEPGSTVEEYMKNNPVPTTA